MSGWTQANDIDWRTGPEGFWIQRIGAPVIRYRAATSLTPSSSNINSNADSNTNYSFNSNTNYNSNSNTNSNPTSKS